MRSSRRAPRLLAAAAVLLLGTMVPAAAERVWIATPGGERGHGWLFGAGGARAGECWIATARHIVEDPYTGESVAFTFTDEKGVSGETELPVAASGNAPDGGKSSGLDDLVFARVAFGREAGKCLSRLGLNAFAYDTALRSSPKLTIYDLLPTSFGTFTAAVDGGGRGAADGRLMLKPTDAAAGRHLKRGLSGAIGEITIAGSPEPFAMVQNVDSGQSHMFALRFDRIREAFEAVAPAPGTGAPVEDIRYDLVSLEGVSVAGSPMALAAGTARSPCWRAVAAPGAPGVRLVIGLPETASALQWLRLGQDPACTAHGAAIVLDARAGGDGEWFRVSDCRLEDDGYRCRLDIRGPRLIRISIFGKDEIGLGGIDLE